MADRVRAVVWSQSAQLALDEAIANINQESPQNARQVLLAALDAAASLATLAERGRMVPELGDGSIRELVVVNYRLMYGVSDSAVTVVGFLRGARDLSKWRRAQSPDV